MSATSLPMSGGIEPAHKRQAREKEERDMGVGGVSNCPVSRLGATDYCMRTRLPSMFIGASKSLRVRAFPASIAITNAEKSAPTLSDEHVAVLATEHCVHLRKTAEPSH